jgi:hypothetical protein
MLFGLRDLPMKTIVVALVWSVTASAVHAESVSYGLKGNDTGGIIAWTPPIDLIYKEVAGDHCARFGKIARITSIHRRIGDYIGFTCLFDRDYDPGQYRYFAPGW